MALEDNQKIGVGLILLGFGFILLGVVLMFDAALIAIGNILFLVGLVFSIGVKRTLSLFARKDRIRGTVCFFFGIILVLLRWGIFGMIIEGFGFINLFGNFLPVVITIGRQFPILSNILDFPVVSQAADYIAGKSRGPKYSA